MKDTGSNAKGHMPGISSFAFGPSLPSVFPVINLSGHLIILMVEVLLYDDPTSDYLEPIAPIDLYSLQLK